MNGEAMGVTERIVAAIIAGGEKAPLFVFAFIAFAVMAAIAVMFLKGYTKLVERADKRDEDVAARERASVETLVRLAAPVERIPGLMWPPVEGTIAGWDTMR